MTISKGEEISPVVVDELMMTVGVDPETDGGVVPLVTMVTAVDGV